MENQQPGPSTAVSISEMEYLKNEIDEFHGEETHKLLKHVIEGIINEINEPDMALSVNSYLKRASKFTALHPNSLQKIHESNTLNVCKETDRKIINDTITMYFIENGFYPSCAHLYDVLIEHIPIYMDKQALMKMLIKMGYIFKMQSDTIEIIENPNITFERYLYLKKIDQYRKESRNIIFIGEASASSAGKLFNLDETITLLHKNNVVRSMFAISASGLMNLHIVKEFNEECYKNWVVNEIIPIIKVPSSVIVLDNSEHHNEKFCNPPVSLEKSLKVEIKEWLKYHEVPYSDDMSKTQLWDLAEKCTDIYANVFVVDNIIKQHGHEVLRLPDCINNLSLATVVLHLINSLKSEQEKCPVSLLNILKSVGISSLKEVNSQLIEEEQHLLKLEDLRDGIDPNSFKDKKRRVTDTELPCFSDFDCDLSNTDSSTLK